MGALYLALDPAIDRLVALKLLRVDGDEMRARFLREARSAGRLQHPHIVTVYDVGEHDGQPFIAMEYVKGETLGELIQRRAPLVTTQKLALMEDLCAGLEYAHREGLVHRDIKPANLMVTPGAEGLKILDFGIARGSGDAGLTEVGTMIGTPNYMSPEQASGAAVDQRSDIFAVGSVIYEVLAYKQAFPGKEWQVVLPRILNDSPEPLAEIVQGINPRLDSIVGKALARSPDDRYQDLETLKQDLEEFRQDLEAAEAETSLPIPTPTPIAKTPRPTTDRKRLAQLRKAKIVAQVDAARASLERGDVDAAQVAVEEASLLDDDDTQVVRLLEEVRDAHDARQFERCVSTAREQLGSEALTQALSNVDEALEIKPDAESARELRDAVVVAFEERARRREREQLIERALVQARNGLKSGAPEAALRAASEVLVWDPTNDEAAKLKRRALKAGEMRRRREATDRKVHKAIALARHEFESGDHLAAIARLERLGSADPSVETALNELRGKASLVDRQLESAESVRVRTEDWVGEQLTAVRAAIADGRWEDAAAQVQELRARSAATAGLAELEEDVERGRLAARRREDAERYIGDARRRRAAEDYPGALARIDAALALSEDHPEALALRLEIEALADAAEERMEQAAAAQRKAAQEAIDVWLSEADGALRSGRFDDALKALVDVDVSVATATQAVRLRTLKQDADARRAQAREEAVRRRKQRVKLVTDQFRASVAQMMTVARRVAVDRQVQLGAAVVGVLAVVLWWLIPSGSPSEVGGDVSTGALVVSQADGRPIRPPGGPAPVAEAVVGAGVDGLPAAPDLLAGTTSASDAAAAVSAEMRSTAAGLLEALGAGVRVVDRLQNRLRDIRAWSAAGDYDQALQQLDALSTTDPRVASARSDVEGAWNAAAQETADRTRELSAEGDFGEALSLVRGFLPEHGFVDAAREDVEAAWTKEGETVVRRALEMAAAGDHDAAVALLEASDPPHEVVLTTLSELRSNPDCPREIPGVLDALSAFRFESGAAMPRVVADSCGGSFKVEIQNELVRFGAGCERASATAFVPILCEGGSEWSPPHVLSFVLQKTAGSTWEITAAVEMGPEAQPAR